VGSRIFLNFSDFTRRARSSLDQAVVIETELLEFKTQATELDHWDFNPCLRQIRRPEGTSRREVCSRYTGHTNKTLYILTLQRSSSCIFSETRRLLP
jgi:hypothetical protein